MEHVHSGQTHNRQRHTLAVQPNAVLILRALLCGQQEYGTVLLALSSSTFGHLTARNGNSSVITQLEPLKPDEVRAFLCSLNSGQDHQARFSARIAQLREWVTMLILPALFCAGLVEPALSARVNDVVTRTGGVAREVNRFLSSVRETLPSTTRRPRRCTPPGSASCSPRRAAPLLRRAPLLLLRLHGRSVSPLSRALHFHPTDLERRGHHRAVCRRTHSSVCVSCVEACSGRPLQRPNACSPDEAVRFLVRNTLCTKHRVACAQHSPLPMTFIVRRRIQRCRGEDWGWQSPRWLP